METEELVRRYAEAQARNDSETMRRLSHADWREDWPQSGERVPNLEAYRRIHEALPGGMPDIDLREVAGSEDRWVVTPNMTVERIGGSGDSWIVEGIGTYPGGAIYHMVQHLRLRDGLVWRATTYFAAPFEAPAWRSAFVVPIG